jgi:hypothetical protein
MEFRPGDIQLLKNSVILHKRTAYEDWEELERKRHLLRLWLAAPDFDDGDEQLRRRHHARLNGMSDPNPIVANLRWLLTEQLPVEAETAADQTLRRFLEQEAS